MRTILKSAMIASVLLTIASIETTTSAGATDLTANVQTSRHTMLSSSQLAAGAEIAPPFGFSQACGPLLACGPRPLTVRAIVDQMLSPTRYRSDLTPVPMRTVERAPENRPNMDRIALINRTVNRDVRGVERVAAMGGVEGWVRPVKTRAGVIGDCKNFAVEKRARLIEAGFPASDLRYAVVYRHDIGLHAVLVARVAERDYVLDNRTPWVLPWQDAPYTWVKISEPEGGWRQIVVSQNRDARLPPPPSRSGVARPDATDETQSAAAITVQA